MEPQERLTALQELSQEYNVITFTNALTCAYAIDEHINYLKLNGKLDNNDNPVNVKGYIGKAKNTQECSHYRVIFVIADDHYLEIPGCIHTHEQARLFSNLAIQILFLVSGDDRSKIYYGSSSN